MCDVTRVVYLIEVILCGSPMQQERSNQLSVVDIASSVLCYMHYQPQLVATMLQHGSTAFDIHV